MIWITFIGDSCREQGCGSKTLHQQNPPVFNWHITCLLAVKRLLLLLLLLLVIVKMTTHTHPFNGPFPGLPRWAGTRKVKPVWILLKQETVSGSGISWAICKSAPRSRQITMPAPHSSVFYRPDALPAAQPTASKQRRHIKMTTVWDYLRNGVM